MTREEQRILREMKKYLDNCVKVTAKNRKFKKRDYCVYLIKNNMFYSVYFHMLDSREISITFTAKPFWLDDLLWTVLQMEDNLKQPDSLRGTGAFTIWSHVRVEKTNIMTSFEDIDNAVNNGLDELLKLSDEFDEGVFLSNYKNIDWQRNELSILVLLHEKKYQNALIALQNIGNESNTWSFSGFYEETLRYIGLSIQ